uniref:Methionine synthase reductase n=1 Tax=Mesocestoides corti TaxID=53468 RepID=A0A5K3FC45_MESCO
MGECKFSVVACPSSHGCGTGCESEFLLPPSFEAVECELRSMHCMNVGGAKETYRTYLAFKDEDQLSYQPGDSVSIFVQNDEADVSWLLKRMNGDFTPDQMIMLKQGSCRRAPSIALPLETPVTPRLLLRHYIEIHSTASRKTTRILAGFCANEEEKALLLRLSGREGMKLYDALIKATSATLMDLLETFPSCRPSLEAVLELAPPLARRPYSLVGECRKGSAQEISFAFTMIDFTRELETSPISVDGVTFKRYRRRTGVATGHLRRLWDEKLSTGSSPGLFVSLFPNHNGFSHPSNVSDPLILICAGTGVAPFIGFLQLRRRLRESALAAGESWLIFGCRDPNFDVLFADELADFLEDGTLTHLCLCFSRFTGDLPICLPEIIRSKAYVPPGCRYVQDCITFPNKPAVSIDDSTSISKISDRLADVHLSTPAVSSPSRLLHLVCNLNGHIRVCGDAKGMAPAVASAWETAFASWLESQEAAELTSGPKTGAEFLAHLRKERRYVEDVWW